MTQALLETLKSVAPYFLLGLFFAGLIKTFLKESFIKKQLGAHNLMSVFKASLFGIPLPLCSCSVIPNAITLRKSGASQAATSAFLIATPETGLDSIALTYGLLGLPMAILRPINAFFTSSLAGLFQTWWNKEAPATQQKKAGTCCHKNSDQQDQLSLSWKQKLWQGQTYAFVDLFNDISWHLFIGLLLSALISWAIPTEFFAHFSGLQARLAILLLAIPFYICASASTPVAAGLIMKGVSPGTALLLLSLGPATNIANLVVMKDYIGRKGVFLNIVAISIVSLAMSYFVDFLFQNYSLPLGKNIHEGHHSMLETVATILFSAMLVLSLAKKAKKKLSR